MKNLLIALGILIAAVNPASAGQKYGSLAKIPNVSAWAFVDDNSQRLGFDMQASADYVWSTLDEAGVALDNESPYHLEVSVQSTMLRSIANPASATNTVALMVKIECFKQTNEGLTHVLVGSELRRLQRCYGGLHHRRGHEAGLALAQRLRGRVSPGLVDVVEIIAAGNSATWARCRFGGAGSF